MLLHSWNFTSHTKIYLFQDVPRIPRLLLRILFSYLPAAVVAVSGPLTLLPQMRRMYVRRDTVYPGTLTQHSRPNALPGNTILEQKNALISLSSLSSDKKTQEERRRKKIVSTWINREMRNLQNSLDVLFPFSSFCVLKTHQLRCAKGTQRSALLRHIFSNILAICVHKNILEDKKEHQH